MGASNCVRCSISAARSRSTRAARSRTTRGANRVRRPASDRVAYARLDDPNITLIGAFVDAVLAGVIGMQACGEVALLRALAVEPAYRDRGLAAALCERVFVLAGERDIYLLTESADAYFARLGFEPIDRATVPAAIRATAQFGALCPASARVMRR
ncbi:MAG: GNAT family N-acetyltransferase [Kofleriaceae bacterium]